MSMTADADAGLLDVKLLRLLDLLHATRSVTRAAEQLGQSQPTVSIWLGRLRRELRDPLFVRTPEGMQPTPRAEALMPTVRAALDALRLLSAPEQAFDPARTERRFRICMTDASHVTLLPRLLGRLRAAAPGLRLDAARIDAGTGRLLQSGDAELALGYIPDLEAGFYQQALYAQDWVCLTNPGHPRIRQSLSLRQYGEEGHVGIPSGTGHRLLDAALDQAGVERRVMLELPGFLGLAAVVSATDLIATVPRHIGETLAVANAIDLLPCPVPIPSFTVKQHWHARLHHDGGSRWLRATCAALFQQQEQVA
jgi:DNA-binding transcriptional LysR family regulator